MAGAATPSSTSSAVKRKKGPPAFYAVKVGREPGLYYSWEDTRQQTQGFKNPVFKKFNTLPEAEEFLRSDSMVTAKPGKAKFYGVQAGHVPGVYTDYPSVLEQVTGYKGGKQKSFATWEEAQAYVNEGKRTTPSEASAPISLKDHIESSTPSLTDARKPAKKQKKNDGSARITAINNDYEPGTGPLPFDAEDGFDRTITLQPDGAVRHKTETEINARKKQPTGDFEGELKIWTDGAAKGNGRVGALAGIGVWFGRDDDSRNVSEPLLGDGKQTNQRAELTAISRAVDIAPIDRNALIYTDSYYSIKCLTEWFQKWEKNEWKNSAGKAVENKDIIEPIIARIRERELAGAYTKFQWIKGHGVDAGNIQADRLASEGALKDREAVHALATAGASEGQAVIDQLLEHANQETVSKHF
ncbi:ribonuclease H-like protein [Byssothecium circinans]|uniref:ribonuclease H n=1 Tax=Byssothecium circinans TaxID=147558 RepID=A0A6A5U9I2_9PLEO|nr:ribonuclease H-like protein [Byssothecium circinans]